MHRTITKTLAAAGLAAVLVGGVADSAGALEVRPSEAAKQAAPDAGGTTLRWETIRVP